MYYSCGQLIIRCEPFVHILNDKQKSILCDHCFRLNKSLLKCSNCKTAFYCNKKCQRNDWNECHRNECYLYKNYYKQYLNRDCDRFLLRLWLITNSNKEKLTLNHQLYDGKNRCFNDLMTHYNEIKNDKNRMNYFETICKRFSLCQIDFDYEKLFQLFCRMCINSFSILNEDLNETGTALYIEVSVLNHSCQPNAAPVFNGINLQIRALKEIDANEEIVINYIDLKMNRNERQTKLYEQYYFKCQCLKCLNHSDNNIDYSVVKNLDQQMDETITNENEWHKSYSIGMQSIALYNQIYGDFHPDLTVQLMRVLKLKVLITDKLDDREVIQLIKRTENCIKITHGFDHNLYKIFREAIGLSAH